MTTAVTAAASSRLPAELAAGAWVRVHRHNYPTPVVGIVRESRSVLLDETRALFLDADPVVLVRKPSGGPAMDIIAVDLLDAQCVMTTDERLDLLASLMRSFAGLLAERPNSDGAHRDALDADIATAKGQIIDLIGGAW